LNDLLILLTSTFVNDEELEKILEANMRILEDNRAVRVLEARGIKKSLEKGLDRIAELENGLPA